MIELTARQRLRAQSEGWQESSCIAFHLCGPVAAEETRCNPGQLSSGIRALSEELVKSDTDRVGSTVRSSKCGDVEWDDALCNFSSGESNGET